MSIRMKIINRNESCEYPDHVTVKCRCEFFRKHEIGRTPEPYPSHSGSMTIFVPREDPIAMAPMGAEIDVSFEVVSKQ